METAPAADTGLSGTVLFYSQPEPLNKELHGSLGLVRSNTPYGFATAGHVVPITVTEFGMAAVSYPIIFSGDAHQPLAVAGLNGGKNLFISDAGAYQVGTYIPAYVRRYPFVLANDDKSERLIVCIDRASALFTEGGDVPLFDEKGEATEYTMNAIKFCDDFETERRRTESFVKALEALDLFEIKKATFTPVGADGQPLEPQVIAEYYAVSEEKLGKLSADKLVELRDNGGLQQIYAHLVSLTNWDRLIAIALDDQARAAPAGNA
jgi:hypothetical protein